MSEKLFVRVEREELIKVRWDKQKKYGFPFREATEQDILDWLQKHDLGFKKWCKKQGWKVLKA